jgi:hypothetical protein
MTSAWMKEHDLYTDYDYNVWSDEDNKITLTAYRLKVVDLGTYNEQINTDTEQFESITFSLPDQYKQVLFLIDRPNPEKQLTEHGLVDYDDWVDIDWLTRSGAPTEVLEFLQALPEYEPRKETFALEGNLWITKENK